MNTRVKKLLAVCLVLVCALSACTPGTPAPTPAPSASAPAEPTATPAPSPVAAERTKVNLAVLSGPTGVGAAKLWADSDGGSSANDYNVTLCTDNQQVMAGLTNGEFDIAALATNVASTLYHKSNGAIQIAAINTLGVLYILGKGVDGNALSTMADLRGKTLYATGQGANPEYVLNYLLEENGVDPQKDISIVWQAPEEVTATMLQAGEGAVCMLPVPAATALWIKSEGAIQPLLDLSQEWDLLENGSQLTMGCMVVRTAFAQEHPQAVAAFLEEYGASIAYMADPASMAVSSDLNPAELVAHYGIAPSAAIAGKAIPQCNLVCLTGEDMRGAVQGYYEVLFAADPAAIGGSIPDDGFYFFAR